jgi:hypothetical protein
MTNEKALAAPTFVIRSFVIDPVRHLLRSLPMKYMLLCYDDEMAWEKAGAEALRQAMQEAVQLTHEINAKGQYVDAAPLESVSLATSVRVREGTRLVTDGPFAETREVLGGYYLIDVEDLDAAIRIAERHPGARVGTVEIRPLLEIPGLPER